MFFTKLKIYFLFWFNEINDFIYDSKNLTANLIQTFSFEPNQKIKHNKADSDTVFKLYGLNKWANENDNDLVIHIHFNDYPRKNKKVAGKYQGYSVYIPEKQLPNHIESQKFAEIVSEEMSKYFSSSNLKIEEGVIMESQELIAVGANNTLSVPSVLIEYSYIYEDFLQSENEKDLAMKNMVLATKTAIEKYFKLI